MDCFGNADTIWNQRRNPGWSRIPAILAEEPSVSERFHCQNTHIFLHQQRQDVLDEAVITGVSRIDWHLASIELICHLQDSLVRDRCPMSAKPEVTCLPAFLRLRHDLKNSVALALFNVCWRVDGMHLPKIEMISS